MIPVWNGWHFTDGYEEPCRFCTKPTRDLCFDPPKPITARRYLTICSGCRRVLRKLRLLSTHGEWERKVLLAEEGFGTPPDTV